MTKPTANGLETKDSSQILPLSPWSKRPCQLSLLCYTMLETPHLSSPCYIFFGYVRAISNDTIACIPIFSDCCDQQLTRLWYRFSTFYLEIASTRGLLIYQMKGTLLPFAMERFPAVSRKSPSSTRLLFASKKLHLTTRRGKTGTALALTLFSGQLTIYCSIYRSARGRFQKLHVRTHSVVFFLSSTYLRLN
jgi:hypothetical protein